MSVWAAVGIVGAVGIGRCCTLPVKKSNGLLAHRRPAVYLKGGQVHSTAAGVVENPESPWVMVCHGGRNLFVNQETGRPTLEAPAEGYKAMQELQEADQFQQLKEQAEKYDSGVYNAESRWFKLTQAGRVVYFNKETMLTTLVKPPEGVLAEEEFPDKKQFDVMYKLAKKRDSGVTWVKISLGKDVVYVNPETSAVTLAEPPELLRHCHACC